MCGQAKALTPQGNRRSPVSDPLCRHTLRALRRRCDVTGVTLVSHSAVSRCAGTRASAARGLAGQRVRRLDRDAVPAHDQKPMHGKSRHCWSTAPASRWCHSSAPVDENSVQSAAAGLDRERLAALDHRRPGHRDQQRPHRGATTRSSNTSGGSPSDSGTPQTRNAGYASPAPAHHAGRQPAPPSPANCEDPLTHPCGTFRDRPNQELISCVNSPDPYRFPVHSWGGGAACWV